MIQYGAESLDIVDCVYVAPDSGVFLAQIHHVADLAQREPDQHLDERGLCVRWRAAWPHPHLPLAAFPMEAVGLAGHRTHQQEPTAHASDGLLKQPQHPAGRGTAVGQPPAAWPQRRRTGAVRRGRSSVARREPAEHGSGVGPAHAHQLRRAHPRATGSAPHGDPVLAPPRATLEPVLPSTTSRKDSPAWPTPA